MSTWNETKHTDLKASSCLTMTPAWTVWKHITVFNDTPTSGNWITEDKRVLIFACKCSAEGVNIPLFFWGGKIASMFVKFEDNLRLIVIGCLHIISLVDFISETSNYKTEKSQQVPTKLVATENTSLTRPQNSSEHSEWEAPLVPHSQLYITGSQVGRGLWPSQHRAFKTPQGDSGPPAFTFNLPAVRAQWMECHLPHSPWFSDMLTPWPLSVIRSPL